MVEFQPSKLVAWVRFPSLAPRIRALRLGFYFSSEAEDFFFLPFSRLISAQRMSSTLADAPPTAKAAVKSPPDMTYITAINGR